MSRPPITRADGYVMAWLPDHPSAHDGRVYEHRVVMERKLGRPLRKGEVVHHLNENPSDNRPENLSLVPSLGEHRNLHRLSHCKRGHSVPHSSKSLRNDKGERCCCYCGYAIGPNPRAQTCRYHRDLPALEPFDDRYVLTEQE